MYKKEKLQNCFLFQSPYNQVTYSIVSQSNNANLFSIQQDGVIRITNTVTSSSDAQYTVSQFNNHVMVIISSCLKLEIEIVWRIKLKGILNQ